MLQKTDYLGEEIIGIIIKHKNPNGAVYITILIPLSAGGCSVSYFCASSVFTEACTQYKNLL